MGSNLVEVLLMAVWNRIDWPVEKMRHWYEIDGLSVAQIAKRLNQSPKLVWKVCNKHNFHMRPVGSCPGSKNPSWKGGKTIDKSGYVMIWMPTHHSANSSGYVREHRLVAEEMLGRKLKKKEVVHHKNDDRSDNRPCNLEVFASNGKHLADTLTGRSKFDWPSEAILRQMYVDQLMSIPDIAEVVGCSPATAKRRLVRVGVPIRNNSEAQRAYLKRHAT